MYTGQDEAGCFGVKFLWGPSFARATFSDKVDFTKVTFSGDTCFDESAFCPSQNEQGCTLGSVKIDDTTGLPVGARRMDREPNPMLKRTSVDTFVNTQRMDRESGQANG